MDNKNKRTCIICGQTQLLAGEIRSDTCIVCRLKVRKPRLNTGKGWYLSKNGYLCRRINNKLYYQHRYIMEQYLGRKLERKEQVHHINGNRSDNRKENLLLCKNRKEHAAYHPEIFIALHLKLKQNAIKRRISNGL